MTPEKRRQYTATQRAKRQRERAKIQRKEKLDALDRKALLDLDILRSGPTYRPYRSPLCDL